MLSPTAIWEPREWKILNEVIFWYIKNQQWIWQYFTIWITVLNKRFQSNNELCLREFWFVQSMIAVLNVACEWNSQAFSIRAWLEYFVWLCSFWTRLEKFRSFYENLLSTWYRFGSIDSAWGTHCFPRYWLTKVSLFSHCDDQLTIFVNFSCYAYSKFWFIGNPRKNKCPRRIRNRAIRGLNSLDSKAQSQIQWRGSMSSLIDDLSYWAVPCNGVLTVQHIKRLEFRLCHMWHCSWIMAVRVGHCRKST